MKIYLSAFLLVFSLHTFAQNISGRAYYTVMVTMEKPKLTSKQMEDPQMRELAAQLEKPFTDEFVLEFTQNESQFKKMPKLEKPDPKKGGISISMSIMGDEEVLYKNLEEDRLLNEKELYSKKFLIDDKLEARDWKLHKESKTIGDYICFKATYIPSEDEDEDEDEDASRLRSGGDGKEGNKEVIAWYTPQIPVKNGPSKYQGLPGLILEVNEGRRKYVCTKIVLNPKEAMEIRKPKKGKKVSQEEFKSIVTEKNKAMKETFKMRKRRD